MKKSLLIGFCLLSIPIWGCQSSTPGQMAAKGYIFDKWGATLNGFCKSLPIEQGDLRVNFPLAYFFTAHKKGEEQSCWVICSTRGALPDILWQLTPEQMTAVGDLCGLEKGGSIGKTETVPAIKNGAFVDSPDRDMAYQPQAIKPPRIYIVDPVQTEKEGTYMFSLMGMVIVFLAGAFTKKWLNLAWHLIRRKLNPAARFRELAFDEMIERELSYQEESSRQEKAKSLREKIEADLREYRNLR